MSVTSGKRNALAGNPTVGDALPNPDKPITVNAGHAGNLTTRVAAVKATGLVDALAGPGPSTVSAPTDAAFAALPRGTVDALIEPGNLDRFRDVLTRHVVSGDFGPAGLDTMIIDEVTMAAG